MKPNHALNDLLHVAKMPRSSFYYKEIKRNYHEAKARIKNGRLSAADLKQTLKEAAAGKLVRTFAALRDKLQEAA